MLKDLSCACPEKEFLRDRERFFTGKQVAVPAFSQDFCTAAGIFAAMICKSKTNNLLQKGH
ncbi:MAG: hypothetical protein IKA65_05310 [Lentisphaeria bacterium]|nr:hypothetical protein [Lentisphaeria bacterium]